MDRMFAWLKRWSGKVLYFFFVGVSYDKLGGEKCGGNEVVPRKVVNTLKRDRMA